MRVSNFAYCCECREDTRYAKIVQNRYLSDPKDMNVKVPYQRLACLCTKCFNEVYVPSIHEQNVETLKKEYEKLCEKI